MRPRSLLDHSPSLTWYRAGSLLLAASVILGACDRGPAPTWSEDVAPILWGNCAVCHRPGEVAPFPLLTYEQAEKRASQIADVTASGFMPPWLPEPGHGDFAGERRLEPGQIETLRRWAEAGAPRGDPAELPPEPEWTPGWHLGEPDLVITASEPVVVPAEGRDVFRNLVLPMPVEERKWVRAVEFRSDNPVVVHHVILQVDDTGAARARDAADPGPGFGGMDLSDSRMPDGQFLGWTPGRVPDEGLPGVAWRLEPGMDLTVQLHLITTGRPEPVRPSVGIFFADEPPTRHPFGLMLGSQEIDIPAGAKGYEVRDSFRLPVDVEALGIYPHAHYLGDTMEVWAEPPAGGGADGATSPDRRIWLIKIDDWDFNWQDEYRYAQPVPLPAGSVIHMRFTYDNTADNPLNPHYPPRRVTYGYQSSDEMGFVLLRLLPGDRAERQRLQVAQLEHALEKRPGEWRARGRLGKELLAMGRLEPATRELTRALEEAPPGAPERGSMLTHLGQALGRAGRAGEALEALRRAVEEAPELPEARTNLGVALDMQGRVEEAERLYRQALELDPTSPEAHLNLARLLASRGRMEEARRHAEEALESLPPQSPRARALARSLGREVGP